jgi:rfaE bifunctional protein kinase chain/domain
MKQTRVKEILEKIKSVRVAVYGDFCLDAYWILSPKGGEISVETSLQSQGVKKHYYTLGGASNIVANLAALEPAHIRPIGTIGNDIFGREITSQLNALGVDTNAITTQKENFDTVTFAKRYLDDAEQPRIDFGFFNKRSKETDDVLIKNLRAALKECDVLIFNQQVPGSITNADFIQRANDLFREFNDSIVLLDSRHYSEKFNNVYRKTNDIEAARLNGIDISAADVITCEDAEKYAAALFEKSRKPVFVTQGAGGILVADSQGLAQLPAVRISNKIDTVGAGDTTISAIALCLGANLAPAEAAEFANLAAAVTIQKLFKTGTASPNEILKLSTHPN